MREREREREREASKFRKDELEPFWSMFERNREIERVGRSERKERTTTGCGGSGRDKQMRPTMELERDLGVLEERERDKEEGLRKGRGTALIRSVRVEVFLLSV